MKKGSRKKAASVRKLKPQKKQKPKQRGERKKYTAGKKKARTDWEINDQLICDKFFELLMRKQKMPTYVEIAKELNVAEKTIERHINDISFDERFKKFRLASDKVVINLLKNAATGKNDKMIRLWLEKFEGLGEKKSIDITSKGEKITPNIIVHDEATRIALLNLKKK